MDKINIVLISDANDLRSRLIERELSTFFWQDEITVFNCSNENIEHCLGCFSCRYKTPGKCIYNDAMSEIIQAMVKSDMIILLSKMECGCYSPEMKKVLDRSIPFETPFLRTVCGETHLVPRYPKKRKLLTIAYSEEIDAEEAVIFSRLTKRNSINFDAEWVKPMFLRAGEDVSRKLRRIYGEFSK